MQFRKYRMDNKELLNKMRKFCAYQERSPFDVKRRLWSMQLPDIDIEKIIQTLKKEDFLNEERFVDQFVRGKLNQKRWGKLKIAEQLRQKAITENTIRLALEKVDSEIYCEKLEECAEKWLRLKGESNDNFLKLHRYLLSKGFENDLIKEKIKKLK